MHYATTTIMKVDRAMIATYSATFRKWSFLTPDLKLHRTDSVNGKYVLRGDNYYRIESNSTELFKVAQGHVPAMEDSDLDNTRWGVSNVRNLEWPYRISATALITVNLSRNCVLAILRDDPKSMRL